MDENRDNKEIYLLADSFTAHENLYIETNRYRR